MRNYPFFDMAIEPIPPAVREEFMRMRCTVAEVHSVASFSAAIGWQKYAAPILPADFLRRCPFMDEAGVIMAVRVAWIYEPSVRNRVEYLRAIKGALCMRRREIERQVREN